MSSISRPIQIEEFIVALAELSDGELIRIKKELEKSVTKLDKTNKKLAKLISNISEDESKKLGLGEYSDVSDDDDDDDEYEVTKEDVKLFSGIIHENQVVKNNQSQRIEAIEDELESRGLSGVENSTVDEVHDSKPSSTAKAATQIDTDNGHGDSNAANSIFV